MKQFGIEEIKERLEEEGFSLTEDIHEAIYILPNGEMISGDFDSGVRGTDHRMIESLLDVDRYDDDFWSKVHAQTGVVMYVPETQYALIAENQPLTGQQKELLNRAGAKIEMHCKEFADKKVSKKKQKQLEYER